MSYFSIKTLYKMIILGLSLLCCQATPFSIANEDEPCKKFSGQWTGTIENSNRVWEVDLNGSRYNENCPFGGSLL